MREAIKALESVGVLESRRGIGVFVKAFSFEPLLENLAYGLGGALRQIEEVIAIRRALEIGLIDKTWSGLAKTTSRSCATRWRRCASAPNAAKVFLKRTGTFTITVLLSGQ
ncbi:GntR family transcriptional regulator [Brucella neotomae]|nr:GntR family transcriptional regulator [Brucella neotomae]